MSTDKLISSAVELLMDANTLIKEQADEREKLFARIVRSSLNSELRKDVDLTSNKLISSEQLKTKQLAELNHQIRYLDHMEKRRDQLLDQISQIEANEKSRDELITILNEYIEIEEATIYRLVSNYSEAQEILEETKKEAELFELLSQNDPRLKALQALKSHPEGISMIQLSFMLGTTQYHARKIINELVDLNLVIKENSLLRFVQAEEIELNSPINITS